MKVKIKELVDWIEGEGQNLDNWGDCMERCSGAPGLMYPLSVNLVRGYIKGAGFQGRHHRTESLKMRCCITQGFSWFKWKWNTVAVGPNLVTGDMVVTV